MLHMNEKLRLRERDDLEDLSWREQRWTDGVILEKYVYGREGEKDEIIDLLISDDAYRMYGDDDNGPYFMGSGVVANAYEIRNFISGVAIVGMGGMGKTTLAKLVYHDKMVSDVFEKKAWVCVSDNFDICTITKKIIKEFTGEDHDEFCQLDLLQVELCDALEGKRLLLVLDDVWNEYIEPLDTLLAPLVWAAAQGSRVLLTTRSTVVTDAMMVVKLLHLGRLSEDYCWSIFEEHALSGRCVKPLKQFQAIGRKIVQKCGGLPLAVRTIGGLLGHEDELSKWEQVLENGLWSSQKMKHEIFAPLKLSYLYLPSYLKPCFTCFSIFHKDEFICPLELTYIWKAHGYLHVEKKMSIEDVGSRYIDELIARSMLGYRKASDLQVHDLLHTLAENISTNECPKIEQFILKQFPSITHFSIDNSYDISASCDLRFVRSFYSNSYLSIEMTKENLNLLFSHMKNLRVLVLAGVIYGELPESIGELKHLRYLDLNIDGVECLPYWISKLCNLQILSSRPSLHKSVTNLTNLQIIDTKRNDYLPSGIGRLTNLETLLTFNVGRNKDEAGIEELKEMVNLRGELMIKNLSNVMDPKDARAACLENQKYITSLVFDWYHMQDDYDGEAFSDESNKSNSGDESKEFEGETDNEEDLDTDDERALVDELGHLESQVDGKEDLDLKINHEHEVSGPNTLSTKQRDLIQVFEALKPHINLVTINISECEASHIPKWLGHPSYLNLATVKLHLCLRWKVLPPLGQLPSLKLLDVQNAVSVKTIGPEFYCDPSFKTYSQLKCFPSLESLAFKEMKFEKWDPPMEGQISFPNLKKLDLILCPELKMIEASFPSLKHLFVSGHCPLFMLPAMPSIQTLDCFRSWDNKWLTNSGIEGLKGLYVRKNNKVTSIPLYNLPCLEELQVAECNGLRTLEFHLSSTGSPCNYVSSLRRMTLINCQNLSISSDELPSSLRFLTVRSCNRVKMQCAAKLENMEVDSA